MSTLPSIQNLFIKHTFGREHNEPPAFPVTMQLGQIETASQMGSATASLLQMQSGTLPQDFDQIVRSIGEW